MSGDFGAGHRTALASLDMVLGVRVHGDTVVDEEVALDALFMPVPVPSKVGVPVVFKKMSGTGGDDSHIRNNVIVRFMSDPDDGFAPAEWQYGGRQGPAPPVVLARRDGIPFSVQDWYAFEEFMGNWSEECMDAEDDRAKVSEGILTPERFRSFIREQQRESCPTAFLCELFPVGSTVVADGLSVQELNGKQGKVAQFSRDRVGVQYPDRAVTALKPERLTLVAEPPPPLEEPPEAKRQDTGSAKLARQKYVERQEAMSISTRFVECLHQDTFPEMGDLHLFGVGCDYQSRAQEVLAVWQGATKHGDLTAEQLADALEKGKMKEFFEETCRSLAAGRTPNSTYANQLLENNFSALEWDTL